MKQVRAYLPGIIILVILTRCCLGNLQKVSYFSVSEKITAFANCRSFNTLLFTTTDGYLHLLIGFMRTKDYLVEGSFHQITCNRYSAETESSYVGVLVENSRVRILEQMYDSSIPMNWYLQQVIMQFHRNSPITEISIGQKYVAIGYKSVNIIDIYYIAPNQQVLTSIQLPNQWNIFQMDSEDHLAVVSLVNSTILFQYYLDPQSPQPRVLTSIIQGIPKESPILGIDYKKEPYSPPGQGDFIKIKYLLIFRTTSFYVEYSSNTNALSSYQANKAAKKFCNGQLTGLQQNTIWTQNSEIFINSISQPIIDYTCLTDTQSYVESLYYIISTDGIDYYIDVYDIVSSWIYWIIAGIVAIACCCGCIGGVIKNGGTRGLREICQLVYILFLWCPTGQNIQEIQEALQL